MPSSEMRTTRWGEYHICSYNGVILACPEALRKGKPRISGVFRCDDHARAGHSDAHAVHLAPRPRRSPRAGALAVALGVGLMVFATLGQAGRRPPRPVRMARFCSMKSTST